MHITELLQKLQIGQRAYRMKDGKKDYIKREEYGIVFESPNFMLGLSQDVLESDWKVERIYLTPSEIAGALADGRELVRYNYNEEFMGIYRFSKERGLMELYSKDSERWHTVHPAMDAIFTTKWLHRTNTRPIK
ncbi:MULTISPECIES: hypothetical protein [Bacillus cereus group]|uniref:Uncharacterized protein n=1 Tax=Bacillus thuringiensis TaxID=1428 RepID=A0A9X7ATU1_BACTU|nr:MULTISPECIES: hypothetical protein [Bacillus cereus group]PFT50898.1 hypothetical protein COK72_02495 [Bacillus thuringiensis]PFY22935.1 hypothetical protein COL44_18815 [Bacillus toyonensis]